MSDAADLLEAATEAAQLAYAPYSGYRVGAVAVAEDGSLHRGANVENAAYGSCICAEANAIASAVAAGHRKIETVAVACPDGGECYPCGNCRQIMAEFGVERVVVPDGAGGYIERDAGELLPEAFGPQHLPGH